MSCYHFVAHFHQDVHNFASYFHGGAVPRYGEAKIDFHASGIILVKFLLRDLHTGYLAVVAIVALSLIVGRSGLTATVCNPTAGPLSPGCGSTGSASAHHH